MPRPFILPAIPVLRQTPPKGPGWLHELKFDGYRAQLHKDRKEVVIHSRSDADLHREWPARPAYICSLLTDNRLTIMFCAFDGAPLILRLYGRGQSLMRGTPEYGAMLPHFEEIPGARQIVHLAVDLVQTSCGKGVPLFDYKEDRQDLVRQWARQGAKNIRRFWALKNMESIDGLSTKFEPEIMSSPA